MFEGQINEVTEMGNTICSADSGINQHKQKHKQDRQRDKCTELIVLCYHGSF